MSSSHNPFEEIERLFERMSRQFEAAADRWESSSEPLKFWSTEMEPMAIDLVDRDDEFVATVDLPGFERDEVTVKVVDQTLHVEAEHTEEIDESDEHYVHRERRRESASRSIHLPTIVDEEAVEARMKNGVLTVTLPKAELGEAHRIEIE